MNPADWPDLFERAAGYDVDADAIGDALSTRRDDEVERRDDDVDASGP